MLPGLKKVLLGLEDESDISGTDSIAVVVDRSQHELLPVSLYKLGLAPLSNLLTRVILYCNIEDIKGCNGTFLDRGFGIRTGLGR